MRLLTPSTSLAYPPRLGPGRRRAPDWTQVTDEQVAAEYLRRTIEEPLLLYQFGLPPRRMAFSSTLRGTCAVFGGTQSAKTIGVGVPWAASIAEGLHPALACPESCPQYGAGSCGVHCCPCAARGSADVPGCVAGQAVACPIHPALWWPEPRLVLVGVMKFGKWDEALVPAFERYLSRFPDGSPQWRHDKADHALVHHAGRYRIQAISYEEPKHNESTSPVAILDDEIPPQNFYNFQVYRAAVRNTQIKICGTTFDLLERPHEAAWLFPKIIQKRSSPNARAQVFHLRTDDNVFLEPAARQRYAELREQLIADGQEQEAAIRLDGIPSLRQDACFFSQQAIRRQGAEIFTPQRWYVSIESALPTVDDMTYFRGPTSFPDGCELPPEGRGLLATRRAGTERGGIACYDCPIRCGSFVSPPARARVLQFKPPVLVPQRPNRGEYYQVDVFIPPQSGHRYAAGADNAKGVPGGDYNVMDVLDAHTGHQVAQYHGQCQPHVMAAVMFAIWKAYRPFMVVELNGFGLEILRLLMDDYGVPSQDVFHRLDEKIKLPSGQPSPQPGWWTTRGTKQDPGGTLGSPYGDIPSPLGLYHRLLTSGRIQLHSARSHAQLGAFVQQSGRLGALAGSHDDTVISGALASLAYHLVRQMMEMRPGLLAAPADHEAVGALMAAAAPPPGEKWREPEPPRNDKAPAWAPRAHSKASRRW